MKFFVDSADLEQIAMLNDIGLVDGVTTNPSIIAKSGRDFKTVIKEICKLVDKVLSSEGTQTNVTLCFSANQALLAAKCGASFISPFIGRLDDISLDGLELIEDIRTIYDNYGFETEILAASIRSVGHIKECALIGADVITSPPEVIRKLSDHVLTDKGLAAFMKDWEKTGQTI